MHILLLYLLGLDKTANASVDGTFCDLEAPTFRLKAWKNLFPLGLNDDMQNEAPTLLVILSSAAVTQPVPHSLYRRIPKTLASKFSGFL